MSFDRWRARLAGEKVTTFLQPDAEDEGYYRKPITEPKLAANGQRNGQKQIVGWQPVAYFMVQGMHGPALAGVIGDRDMTVNEITDESLWSWVVRYPISEELYRAVAELGEPWPDLEAPATLTVAHLDRAKDLLAAQADIPAVNREVTRDDNKPPEVLPEVEHAQAIDSAIGAALTKITSEAEAALALGSKNRIAELRLAADKAGKAAYEPPFKDYKRLYGVWNPMIARAVKKEGEIQTAVLTFRESERKRLAKIADDAAEAQRRIDADNEATAQRAIAAGRPEPAPVVVEQPAPVAPQPAPLTPTYGTRKLREELKKFAVIEDGAAALLHFRDHPEIVALLEKLATNAIRSGATVPGATFREGLI